MHLLSVLASFLSLALAHTINHLRSDLQKQPAEGHVVHQFPNGTWVENIVVRRNGQLLVTINTSPEIYLIDPQVSSLDPTSNKTATLIHNFAPNLTAVHGITETNADQFYVIVSDLTFSPLDPGLGSYTVWSLNLQNYDSQFNSGAVVHEVAALTTAGFLNGMSTLSAPDGLIILADSV
jgi:hypothetical protein